MRKIITSVLCLAVVLLLCVSVFAAVPPVVDRSGLLTDQQLSDLNTLMGDIRVNKGYAVNVVTTDSFDGMSAQAYAEDFYDAHIGGDGVLLLVSLEEGYWYISTNGACARQISDAQVEVLGEEIVPLLRDGQYMQAFTLYANSVCDLMEQAPARRTGGVTFGKILVCLFIGLAAGGITVGVMAAKMKSARSQSGAGSYVCPGSLRLTGSHDIFLYNTLRRTPRPKSNGSGGGGGGHSRGGSGGRI